MFISSFSWVWERARYGFNQQSHLKTHLLMWGFQVDGLPFQAVWPFRAEKEHLEALPTPITMTSLQSYNLFVCGLKNSQLDQLKNLYTCCFILSVFFASTPWKVIKSACRICHSLEEGPVILGDLGWESNMEDKEVNAGMAHWKLLTLKQDEASIWAAHR